MHTHRVNILHAADGDGVVIGVTHDLKLDLLVALDALLDEHLMNGRKLEGVQTDLHKLFFVVGKTAARAAEGERGTKNHGITDALCRRLCLVQAICDLGGNGRLTDGLAKLLEKLAVLGALNALTAGTEKLHMALAKHTLLFQLHRKVQARLSADAGNDGVGTLIAQDLCDILQRQRLHIHLVRNGGIGHDGSGVGVDKHYLVALFLERQTRLRARVVKLCRLSDNNGTRADDENFFKICTFCHFASLRLC